MPATMAATTGTAQMSESAACFFIIARGSSGDLCVVFRIFLLPDKLRLKTSRCEQGKNNNGSERHDARARNYRGKSAEADHRHHHGQQKNVQHRPWANLFDEFENASAKFLPARAVDGNQKKEPQQLQQRN